MGFTGVRTVLTTIPEHLLLIPGLLCGVHVAPPPPPFVSFYVSLLFGILIVSLLENIFRQSHCASTCTIQKQLDILGHQSCLMKLLAHLSLQTGRTTKVYTFGLSYPVDLHVFATTIAFRYNMQI